MDFEQEIKNILKKEVKEEIILEKPISEFGDYAFPCFELAKKLKKNPVEIARELANKIKVNKYIEKIEARGPYLNFFADRDYLAKTVIDIILKEKGGYGSKKEKQTIVIDFSGPNIGKPMHVGHIRSTIIGDSLRKIFEFLGNKVIGINYLGDIGLHIGKLIVAYQLWGDDKKIKRNPEKELLNLYIKFCKEEKLSLEQELAKSPDQEDKEVYLENEWTKKAKNALQKLESNDRETIALWKKIKEHSLKGFFDIYKILNIKFDEIIGQSKFSNEGKRLVKEAVKRNIAIIGKHNEVIAKIEPLPDKVILRSDGTALYSTQDMGAALSRYNKHKFDKMIYIAGSEQTLYFQQMFKIFEKLGFNWAENLIHLPFGLVNWEGAKMSTRAGKVIFLQDVINKARELALKEIEKKNPNLKNKEKVSEKVGISALKYSILKLEPIRSINFSYEQALSLEGDTGPYLQYTYARASSILRKAKIKSILKTPKISLKEKEEIETLNKLLKFPE